MNSAPPAYGSPEFLSIDDASVGPGALPGYFGMRNLTEPALLEALVKLVNSSMDRNRQNWVATAAVRGSAISRRRKDVNHVVLTQKFRGLCPYAEAMLECVQTLVERHAAGDDRRYGIREFMARTGTTARTVPAYLIVSVEPEPRPSWRGSGLFEYPSNVTYRPWVEGPGCFQNDDLGVGIPLQLRRFGNTNRSFLLSRNAAHPHLAGFFGHSKLATAKVEPRASNWCFDYEGDLLPWNR